MSAVFRRVLVELEGQGILMHADPVLPSVTTLVAGEPVRGSWWGHPDGRAIYAVLQELGGSGRATSARLVNGKVTFVHRVLWPALAALGGSREAWQTERLGTGTSALLELVEERGELRTDALPPGTSAKDAGELERRLLVHADQIHTESGRHARVLTTWDLWASAAGMEPLEEVSAAQSPFEAVVRDWRQRFGAKVRLPWG